MADLLDLKIIRPRGGDSRAAFEEMGYLLFAREREHLGKALRRYGAGGDGGLEGVIIDPHGLIVAGIQTKFFDDKMGATQWRDLNESVETVLNEPLHRGTLREVVIGIPRNLTPTQEAKWLKLRSGWMSQALDRGFSSELQFTLWHASVLRDLLLRPQHRGLLLHYFEYPDFDLAHCSKKTRDAVANLGDRYQPKLHTSTDAEEILHKFLRSERCRSQFLEESKECLPNAIDCRRPKVDWNEELKELHESVLSERDKIISLLGDGISLPQSFETLGIALENYRLKFQPFLDELAKLIPVKEPVPRSEFYSYSDNRSAEEKVYDAFEEALHSSYDFQRIVRNHILADKQCLLFHGGPGLGKTHVLAEVCMRYSEQGGAVLFFEGASFSSEGPPIAQIMRLADFSGVTVRDFLTAFQALGESSSLKSLICIDALNETTGRSLWISGILALSSELNSFPNIKLIVSCREDYMQMTLPASVVSGEVAGWALAEHHGLGVNVLEALPKYLKAFDVRGFAIPPFAQEFQSPLFLRIFCEAFSRETPPPGTLSLPVILEHYARRKANFIARRIDCADSQVFDALTDLGKAILDQTKDRLNDQQARRICITHFGASEASRSLYQALLSENIIAESPDGNASGFVSKSHVRFTYERVWDYFLSLNLLPQDQKPTESLKALLRDFEWCWHHRGVVSMLAIRLPEEHQVELCDLIDPNEDPSDERLDSFLDSLVWRTEKSLTTRARSLFSRIYNDGYRADEFDLVTSYAINPSHPWNANWLHSTLEKMSLAERDRWWTLWVNQALFGWPKARSLEEIQNWANVADLSLVPNDQLELLATTLSWCFTTTATKERKNVAIALTRVLAGRTYVAARVLRKFVHVNDPYVKEKVLMACAGAAQHAESGDLGLKEMAIVVLSEVFGGAFVDPHVLVRHYASEICIQAEEKRVLPHELVSTNFRPPWRSRWPVIWSAKMIAEKKRECDHTRVNWLYHSVEPGPGFSYGDWGHYEMLYAIKKFQSQLLAKEPYDDDDHQFDVQIAKRFVIQRVFEIGWDWTKVETHPKDAGEDGGKHRVERLSKKYQWIAFFEFLGYLSDHYHFSDWSKSVKPLVSIKQLDPQDLLDPYVVRIQPVALQPTWNFVKKAAPWWRGRIEFFESPLDDDAQKRVSTDKWNIDVRNLLALFDGTNRWITLSAFHEWYEPIPIWKSDTRKPRVKINWAMQSYLVPSNGEEQLLHSLSQHEVSSGHLWIHEPEYIYSMTMLKQFPADAERLAKDCQLDRWHETSAWQSRAVSTTCRFAVDEEERRIKSGSMPSPQLAKLSDLVWMGKDFDFKKRGTDEVLVQHLGPGFNGACVIRADTLKDLLSESGLRIVWRCFSEKTLFGEPTSDCHMRAFWMSIRFAGDNVLEIFDGATIQYPSAYHEMQRLALPRFFKIGPITTKA